VKRRKHASEQLIRKLREAERLLGAGKEPPRSQSSSRCPSHVSPVARAVLRDEGATTPKRLKERALERENVRLKAIVADQALENGR
jgi:putative transposase